MARSFSGKEISIKPGFIYFLSDTDVQTGRTKPYVKLGKTGPKKRWEAMHPVQRRIRDLQTGNPHRIHDSYYANREEYLKVTDMNTVELYLHHVFAEQRILGEWFWLDNDLFNEATREADWIDSQINEHKTAIEQASKNKKTESEERKIEGTSELQDLHQNALKADAKFQTSDAEQECIRLKLILAMGAATGIKGVIEFPQDWKTVINKEAFREKYPTRYDDFLDKRPPEIKGTMKLSDKPKLKELNPALASDRKKLTSEVKKTETDQIFSPALERELPHEKLHLDYLKAMKTTVKTWIELELLRIQIMAACENANQISGICHWERKLGLEPKAAFNNGKFNKSEFFEEFGSIEPKPPRKAVQQERHYPVKERE